MILKLKLNFNNLENEQLKEEIQTLKGQVQQLQNFFMQMDLQLEKFNSMQNKYQIVRIIHQHRDTNTSVALVNKIHDYKTFIAKIYSNWDDYEHELEILLYLQPLRVPKICDTETVLDWKIIIMEQFLYDGEHLFQEKSRKKLKFIKQILEVYNFLL